MSALLFRTRIAVLWVAAAVAASSSVLLYLVVPGALEEMLAGKMEGDPLNDAVGLLLATLVLIPLVMAAVTLLASDRANPYANLVAGLLFALVAAFAVASHLLAGDFDGHVLVAAVGGLLAFLIAGLSAASLRRSASSAPAPIDQASTMPTPPRPDRHMSG